MKSYQRLNNGGFSLVELLVAMGIFSILMLLTSESFKRILFESSKLFKSAESNIEGVVGLQILHKDLAQMGYGLPWTIQGTYLSVVAKGTMAATPVTEAQVLSLNDEPNKPPRAIASLNNVGYNGSDYLAIKSTVVAMNNTAKKSAILRQDTKIPSGLFSAKETLVILNPTFSSAGEPTDKILIGKDSYKNVSSATSTYRPVSANDTYLVYGLDDEFMRAPFNRADYYIARPADNKVPDVCAKVEVEADKGSKGIGILYKSVMNQNGGGFTHYPVLDCVADMQIVYGVDESTTHDGTVGNHYDGVLPVSTDPEAIGYENPATIRANLKEVRVFILAQEGKKDASYTYPNSTIFVGDFGYGRFFDFTTSNIKDWRNYHWKLYTIVVRPGSL
jgi:prepilin-type N-terminal cleavage/methylation domain-containing protein